MCSCTTVPSQDVQRRVTQMTSNMSRYNFFAAWYKMNTCTVLVLAKDVCVILHNLVHFMGCWIHVNLLMLSDMQALHTQRTFIDHSTFQQLIGQSWACFGCLMKGNVVIIRQYHPNHSRMKRATQVICWKWWKRISSYCEIYRGKQKYCLTWGDQDCLYLISLQSVLIFL